MRPYRDINLNHWMSDFASNSTEYWLVTKNKIQMLLRIESRSSGSYLVTYCVTCFCQSSECREFNSNHQRNNLIRYWSVTIQFMSYFGFLKILYPWLNGENKYLYLKTVRARLNPILPHSQRNIYLHVLQRVYQIAKMFHAIFVTNAS
jgi:hypothetical protein